MPKKKEEQPTRYQQFDAWYDKQLLVIKKFWNDYLGIKYVPLIIFAAILIVLFFCWVFDEKWTDVFRALLVPVIAFAALAISWMQYDIKKFEAQQFIQNMMYSSYIELRDAISEMRFNLSLEEDHHLEYAKLLRRVSDRIYDLEHAYGEAFRERVKTIFEELILDQTPENLEIERKDWSDFSAKVFAMCNVHIRYKRNLK